MESRVVADPLRLFHCCPISDGAAALVLTSEPGAVRIAGIGQGTDAIAVRYRADLTSFRATQAAAEAAYRMAGFGPERVEVAEIHDAFAPFELISLEDTGLVPAGKAGREPRSTARRRSAAGCPSTFRRTQGARPPARRDRHRPGRRADVAAPRDSPRGARWRPGSGSPSRSAGSPPTTG